jgi:hypothetical protein
MRAGQGIDHSIARPASGTAGGTSPINPAADGPVVGMGAVGAPVSLTGPITHAWGSADGAALDDASVGTSVGATPESGSLIGLAVSSTVGSAGSASLTGAVTASGAGSAAVTDWTVRCAVPVSACGTIFSTVLAVSTSGLLTVEVTVATCFVTVVVVWVACAATTVATALAGWVTGAVLVATC